MTISTPDSEKNVVKGAMPVMPCHPAEVGGVSGQLVRGAAPSTPNGIQSRYSNPKPESRRMSVKKFFRCTSADNAVIQNNAAKAGLEPSSYMRIQCIGKPQVRPRRHIRADWDELRRLMGAINRIGNLINQLVHHLHRGGIPTNCADAALREVRQAAHEIMVALKRG